MYYWYHMVGIRKYINDEVHMKILGINLSNNPKSINRVLLSKVITHVGGELVPFAQTDFALYKPGDREPEALTALCAKIEKADRIIFSSPEYNGSFSPFGKNVLDWISTKGTFDGFIKQTSLMDKPTLLLTCSSGYLGGCRCVSSLSSLLCELGCVIVKTFSTTGGFNPDTYDYKKVFCIADSFKRWK